MSTRVYRKDDVQTHYGQDRPAVNVKVYRGPSDAWGDFAEGMHDADSRFNQDWLDANVSEDSMDWLFWHVCGSEFEQIEQDAQDIFGGYVTVESDGRSGGWAVVRGLADIEEWDAVALAKWRKFEKHARAIAAGVPEQMLYSLYLNEFEAWRDEESERIGAEAFAA